MHRSLLPAVLSAALALGACDKAGESPVQPSTYGNPVLQLPPPVFQGAESATLVSAAPSSGSVLRTGQTVEAVVEFSLPLQAYPGDAFLSLDAGRVGFTCGHVELKEWPSFVPGSPTRLSCSRPIDESFLQGYKESGQGESLVLRFSVFGPGPASTRYQRFWYLPVIYTVQP